MLRRLSLSMLILIVVFAISLSAVAQGETVTIWFTGDEQRGAALQSAVDVWAEQTGNTATVEVVSWSDAYAQSLAAVNAQEGGDILMGGMSWGISLGNIGGMTDLGETYGDDVAGIALFFLRQYMLSLPDELLDAARVDGATEFRVWWQIVLPLIGPALVAMGIFVFLGEWNNLVWPLIVLQTESLQTLPVILSTMADTARGPAYMGVAMAAALLVSVPTLALFIAFQRQFVQGIALTGMKG